MVENDKETIRTLVINVKHPLAKLLREADFVDIAHKILNQKEGLIGLILNNYRVKKFKRDYFEYPTAEMQRIKIEKKIKATTK